MPRQIKNEEEVKQIESVNKNGKIFAVVFSAGASAGSFFHVGLVYVPDGTNKWTTDLSTLSSVCHKNACKRERYHGDDHE